MRLYFLLIIMGLWGAVGGTNMILYLAGLTGVPPSLYEAAEIDGANGWKKFWSITRIGHFSYIILH